MGGGSSKHGKVKIHNTTTEEVTVHEKNRVVLGPLIYKVGAGKEEDVPSAVPEGTYVRYAVLVGGSEKGLLSTADLVDGCRITVSRTHSGKDYEIITTKPQAGASHTGHSSV